MKNRIRIIKKSEVDSLTQKNNDYAQPTETGNHTIISNVSNWVEDFKTRKKAESKAALHKILSTGPRSDAA